MVLVGSYDVVESHDYYRYACNCKVSQSLSNFSDFNLPALPTRRCATKKVKLY